MPRSFHGAMLRICNEVRPEVRAMLGTSAELGMSIRESPHRPHDLGGTSDDNRHIWFSPELQGYPILLWFHVAAHECAHGHMRGPWETLPLWLEEGLADVVAASVVPEARELVEDLMPAERVPGYRIAGALGLDAVRDLAQRAQRAGLEEIPAEWLREATGLDVLPHIDDEVAGDG